MLELQQEYLEKNKSGTAIISFQNNRYIIEESEECGDCDVVISIDEIEYDDYVYDIETDYGKFQAGVGDIIVSNTDSVFVKFKTPGGDKFKELDLDLKGKRVLEKQEEQDLKQAKDQAMKEAFEMGQRASKEITEALFKKPNLLEFEKVYLPLMLFGKKMYIAGLYESSHVSPDYIDKKGVALKRRDNCGLLKRVYNHIVNLVMDQGERGLEQSLEYLDLEIEKLANNKIPFEELIITKTLKNNYKTANIPHKILAEKMFERDPGSAPRMNERVPFMFIEHPNKKAKLFEKVEDPKYAKEHSLQPDLLYYLDNQLKNPLSQFYGCLIGEEEIEKYFKRKLTNYMKPTKQCEALYRSGVKKGQRCSKDVLFDNGVPKKTCGVHSKWFQI